MFVRNVHACPSFTNDFQTIVQLIECGGSFHYKDTNTEKIYLHLDVVDTKSLKSFNKNSELRHSYVDEIFKSGTFSEECLKEIMDLDTKAKHLVPFARIAHGIDCYTRAGLVTVKVIVDDAFQMGHSLTIQLTFSRQNFFGTDSDTYVTARVEESVGPYLRCHVLELRNDRTKTNLKFNEERIAVFPVHVSTDFDRIQLHTFSPTLEQYWSSDIPRLNVRLCSCH